MTVTLYLYSYLYLYIHICIGFDSCLDCFATIAASVTVKYKHKKQKQITTNYPTTEQQKHKQCPSSFVVAANVDSLVLFDHHNNISNNKQSSVQASGSLDLHQTRKKSLSQQQTQSQLLSQKKNVTDTHHDHATHGYFVCDSTRFPSFTLVKNLAFESALSKLTHVIVGKGSSSTLPGGVNVTGKESPKLASSATEDTGKMNEVTKVSSVKPLDGLFLKSTPSNPVQEEQFTSINRDSPRSTFESKVDFAIEHDLSKNDMEVTEKSANELSLKNSGSNTPTDHTLRGSNFVPHVNYELAKEEKFDNNAVAPNDDVRCSWTIEEDLCLLDAIEENGLGNWIDISEAISTGVMGGSNKTAKRCMDRYWDDYLGRYGHIVPPFFKLTDGSIIPSESLPEYEEIVKYRQQDSMFPEPLIGQIVGRQERYKVEIGGIKALALASTSEEMNQIREECKMFAVELPPRADYVQDLPGSEFSGFMPRRGDFDVEWENDAEHILAGLLEYFVIT